MKKILIEKPNIKKIDEIAKRIVELFNPEKIILFGSFVYGKTSRYSDIDILVIMNTKKRTIRQAAEISGSIDHKFPIDIIVKRPEEIEWRIFEGDCFYKEILEKGKVLYEKDN